MATAKVYDGSQWIEITDESHRSDAADAHNASAIDYDNTTSGLTATNSQDAIDELAASPGGGATDLDDLTDVDTTTTPPTATDVLAYDGSLWVPTAAGTPGAHASSHEDGGADEIEIANLPTSETDTALVLHPDGAGGVVWGTDATGAGGGGSGATFVASSTATGASPVTINKPTGTAEGDLMIIAGMFTNSIPNVNGPNNDSSWTEMMRFDTSSNEFQVVWYKVAGASEPASWTLTHSAGTDIAIVAATYRGVDTRYNEGYVPDSLVTPAIASRPQGDALQVCIYMSTTGTGDLVAPASPFTQDAYYKAGSNFGKVLIGHAESTLGVVPQWTASTSGTVNVIYHLGFTAAFYAA